MGISTFGMYRLSISAVLGVEAEKFEGSLCEGDDFGGAFFAVFAFVVRLEILVCNRAY